MSMKGTACMGVTVDETTDETPRVLDASQRNQLPTGRVTITAPEGYTDRELAQAAGFNSSHHGVDVTRYDDGTALVSLWND